jgi:hypothetical protein
VLVIYGLLFTSFLKSIAWNPLEVENEYLKLVIDTIISTFVVLVFGEFIPKAIFKARNDKLIAFFDQFFTIHPNYTVEEYVNLDTRKSFGAESGFIIVNTSHANYNQYVKNYETLYSERDPAITHWYDSEVVVLAARPFLKQVFDLSSLRTTNKTQTPINRCWLTVYFSHQTAKSKTQYSINQLRELCGLAVNT